MAKNTKKDRFPQWMRMSQAVEGSANSYTEAETITPTRLSFNEVIEILGIEYQLVGHILTGVDVDIDAFSSLIIRTQPHTALGDLNDGDLIGIHQVNKTQQFAEVTETGGAGSQQDTIKFVNYAVAGKGFLTAAQALFLGVVSGSASIGPIIGRARILYRVVEVSAAELIGLLAQLTQQVT